MQRSSPEGRMGILIFRCIGSYHNLVRWLSRTTTTTPMTPMTPMTPGVTSILAGVVSFFRYLIKSPRHTLVCGSTFFFDSHMFVCSASVCSTSFRYVLRLGDMLFTSLAIVLQGEFWIVSTVYIKTICN